jgi:hypothetical protein
MARAQKWTSAVLFIEYCVRIDIIKANFDCGELATVRGGTLIFGHLAFPSHATASYGNYWLGARVARGWKFKL